MQVVQYIFNLFFLVFIGQNLRTSLFDRILGCPRDWLNLELGLINRVDVALEGNFADCRCEWLVVGKNKISCSHNRK